LDGLGKRADAFRRVVGRDSLSHGLSMLGGLGDLARAQAAGADADPAGATVDHRPHRLQVRLEPARAHVVGVAHGTTDDRSLVTNLAALGHCKFSTCPAPVPAVWTNTKV